MKSLSLSLLLCVGVLLWTLACTNAPAKQLKTKESSQKEADALSSIAQIDTTQQPHTMTDPRDGEIYTILKIGEQVWMGQNLRFNASGSMLNPDNPAKAYGRLYKLIAAQTACPGGWHLPSDAEWDKLEMAHGMPASFVGQGGWRGKHATQMKSTTAWEDDGNGTDRLGFTVLPAGYYFSEKFDELAGLQGLGSSAAFWSSMEGNQGMARFMFSPRTFVNKWEDDETGAALSCRCVQD